MLKLQTSLNLQLLSETENTHITFMHTHIQNEDQDFFKKSKIFNKKKKERYF